MRQNAIKEKSYSFALRIIKLYKFLLTKNEYVMSKQILKCGTSVGANVREALQAESKLDFIHKLNIGLKEASETEYWLQLLWDSNYIDRKSYNSINNDCIEIIKLITSIIKTTEANLNRPK
jgi:four helix bundle protein